MINKKPVGVDPKFITRMNIRNLSLNIMLLERGGYKVILPRDCSELARNLDYGNESSIRGIDFTGASARFVENMDDIFSAQNSLIYLNLCNLDTSHVTSTNWMFYGCKKLTSLDLSNFNTANVTDMGRMFKGCVTLKSLNLSNFDTQKVTDMNSMFCQCPSIKFLDLSSFKTERVEWV